MPEEIDIFVSYKRYGDWTPWVQGEFLNVLRSHLGMELGRDPNIFIDSNLESGTTWPLDLAQKLAHARVVIPLISKMYFSSEWCVREIYAARYKENELGFRTIDRPEGIIVPATIHDGNPDDLPEEFHDCCEIQAQNLVAYALTSLQRGSPLFTEFEATMKAWIQNSICPALKRSYQHPIHPDWNQVIADKNYPCPTPADFTPKPPSLG